MVLEELTTPEKAEKRPWDLLFIGAMYAAIAVFLAVWIFKDESSIVMVLLTVIACIPLVHNTMKFEEERDVAEERELFLIKGHGKALAFFMCLFMGCVFAYTMAYIFLPEALVHTIFRAQENTIRNINSQVISVPNVGKAIDSQSVNAASTAGSSLFLQIFSNNLKVMLFCLFFSFFYGAGSIFILTWNASVISAAIGSFFRTNIAVYANQVGLAKLGGYFHIYSLSLLRYSIHGLPEILAYFIGGLAGGIISIAVIRHDFGSKTFKRILLDSVDLIMLAVVVLLIAAVIEVYVTPAFF